MITPNEKEVSIVDCFFHGNEEFVESVSFKHCFECQHVFQTEQELVDADYEVRKFLRDKFDRGLTKKLDSGSIDICPLCTHDF